MHSQTHLPWLNKPLGQMTISQTYAWPWTKRLPPGVVVDDGLQTQEFVVVGVLPDHVRVVRGRDQVLHREGRRRHAGNLPAEIHVALHVVVVDDGAVVRMAMAATTTADAAVPIEGRRRLDFILFLYGTIGSADQQPC